MSKYIFAVANTFPLIRFTQSMRNVLTKLVFPNCIWELENSGQIMVSHYKFNLSN
jgi:hypothetical protein